MMASSLARKKFVGRSLPSAMRRYDGSKQRHVVTEVTFEDGRKGAIEANVDIVEMEIYPSSAAAPLMEAAE